MGWCSPEGRAPCPLQPPLPRTLSKGASKRVSSSDTVRPQGTTSFGAALCAGLQSLGHSWRSPSSCPSSWLPVPGRRLCFGVHPKAIPPAHQAALPLLPVAFHMGCTEKRGKREENASLQEALHYVPPQTGLPPALTQSCAAGPPQSLGQVPPHILPQVQDDTSAQERIAQPACEPPLPAPRSLAGLSPGKETAGFLVGYRGGFSGSPPATPHQHQVPW